METYSMINGSNNIDRLKELRKLNKKHYRDLIMNLARVNNKLVEINRVDLAEITEKLRAVERKVGLVMTLFKSSVFTVNVTNQDSKRKAEDELEEYNEDGTNRPIF